MKKWLVLSIDATDDIPEDVIYKESFKTQEEAEAKFNELKKSLSNVYLAVVLKQQECI